MSSDPTRVKGRIVKYTKFRISVIEGASRDLGRQLEIAGKSLRVGSDPDNDLVLNDNAVSRHHCEIEASLDGVSLRDLRSTNGVWVAGVRVYHAVLPAAANIRIGDTLLGITPSGETVDRIEAEVVRFGDVLGASARMRELFADLQLFAATDMSLLIEGETGTGKDIIAESVHRASARSEGPYVVLDCAALPPNLAEGELFGHERGAFTRAVDARPGLFEQAHGGTLFVDEIGELPKDLQPKLLRALEKREVRRLGGRKVIPVDVRIVAATNRNLQREAELGNFREDLYFRLSAASVLVPPLRERMADLPLLIEHFLALARPPRTIEDACITPEAWEMLRSHRWPGNVRELRNAVQRLLVTPERPIPTRPADKTENRPSAPPVSEPAAEPLTLQEARREATDEFERKYLRNILAKVGGNIPRAALIAGISRQGMHKLARKHGLIGENSPEAE